MATRDVSIGVTVDGYAVEGGFDVEGAPATSFLAAQSLGRVRASVRSPGTFEHLDDLVAAASALGCREVRLTLEWARLERRPGERDEGALDRYLAALGAAKAASMRTVVVLCDAAWPSWLGQEPWLSAWAPQRFAAHAAWVGQRAGELVDAVVTFRAPNVAAQAGWRTATRPPFRTGAAADEVAALDGMLVAHQRAVVALASELPAATCALLLGVAARYEDGALWRDLAAGIADPVALGARRDRFGALRRQHGVRPPRPAWRRRPTDVTSLRSTPGWASLPPWECWLAGEDLDLLAVALEHADGTVGTVELGAGPIGWDAQLGVALPALRALHPEVRTVHLHGLVGSTGPLEGPVGLVEVHQHDGAWSLGAVDPARARGLASLGGDGA